MKSTSRSAEISFLSDTGRYKAHCPWVAIDSEDSLVFAALMGSSMVLQGLIAALRTEKELEMRLPGNLIDTFSAKRDFRVFYDRGKGEGADRLAIAIIDPRKLNRIEIKRGKKKEETIEEATNLAFAFGTDAEEIAFDICDQLDIPLLPGWSEDFVRMIRNQGWLKRITSIGLEYVWEFKARRSDYLNLLAAGLGSVFKAGSLDQTSWRVRPVVERTKDSVTRSKAALFTFSRNFEEKVNNRTYLSELACPEQVLIDHRASVCVEGYEPIVKLGDVEGGYELTTFHSVNSKILEISTRVFPQDTKTRARFVDDIQTLAA